MKKPRHNPNKRQNRYGNFCPYYEETRTGSGFYTCEVGVGDVEICKGNRHNCVKVKYKKLACRSDKQKNEI